MYAHLLLLEQIAESEERLSVIVEDCENNMARVTFWKEQIPPEGALGMHGLKKLQYFMCG